MKKATIEGLSILELSSEEKKIISKINRNLSLLEKETNLFLNKDDDFINGEDLKSIFFGKEKNNEALLLKYKEIINELKLGIDVIVVRSKEKIHLEKKIEKPIMGELTFQIINTIENIDRFFLKNTKLEALSKIKELQKIKDVKKSQYYVEKINALIEEIDKVSKAEEFIELDSLERDLEIIRNIQDTPYKKFFKASEITITLFLAFLAFLALIVAITLSIT